LESDNNNSFQRILELSNTGIENVGVEGFLIIMIASLLSSWVISALYLAFYGSRATGSQIHRAFPLLGLSVTTIFICIQFSLPLSLGLLGALSIVRFRTPIKEPEEIGFIMIVIAASIAIATFSMHFLLVLIGFMLIALLVQKYSLKFLSRSTSAGLVLLTVGSERYTERASQLQDLMKNKLVQPNIESVSRSGNNSTISYSFRKIRSDDPVDLQASIQELLDPEVLNIYFNKQATL